MKKIDIILLSLVIVGTSCGETNDQNILTKKLNKEKLNHSVEALVKIMREMKVKKEEAGEVSDTVCKILPWRCALVGGIVSSLNAMLFWASDRKQSKQYLESSEIIDRGAAGFILGSIGSWVVAKILFGLCDSRRRKRNMKKRVDQQYQPKIEALKEKIHRKLASDNLSKDEKNELIGHLENVYGLQYESILKR